MTDTHTSEGPSRTTTDSRWYELFSRGARDWLRHNAKLREAVKKTLPEAIAGADILSRPDGRTLRVPVKFLEHYRFRLHETGEESGVGQGKAEPGDVYAQPGQGEGAQGEGGSGSGELRFVFELSLDDVVDWIWEELELPDLKPKTTDSLVDSDIVREGWDKRGPRARLDRRRTTKEAIKRRIAQSGKGTDSGKATGGEVTFSDEDLRFHQIAHRPRPSTQAVAIFMLDVSASMDERRRKLAKSFFFWAVQGLRRRYKNVETVFLAHTNEAWEFSEEDFFRASATGGTVASTAFKLAREILLQRFDPGRYNAYAFYASDGDNFADDRVAASESLTALCDLLNFMGLVETPQNHLENGRSETGRLFKAMAARDYPVGAYTVHEPGDIWEAIRRFFHQQAHEVDSA